MSPPILYTFRRCPYCIRARMALAYAGITVEIREVDLRNKPAALLAISPKATVPVLQLAGGTVIEQSLEIMQWALAQNDPEGWLEAQSTLTDELILANDTSFKKNLDRFKYHSEASEHPREHYHALASEFLRHLERCLDKSEQRGLARASTSLADMAIFPFVRQFAEADSQWQQNPSFPYLQVWLRGHIRSERFAQAMKKYPLWQAGDAPLIEEWPQAKSAATEQDVPWVKINKPKRDKKEK